MVAAMPRRKDKKQRPVKYPDDNKKSARRMVPRALFIESYRRVIVMEKV